MSDPVTWAEVLADVSRSLGSPIEARWVCEEASGLAGHEFDAASGERLTTAMAAAVERIVARRLAGEPIQYALGRWAFRHLDVMVDRRVLIPRPETEIVAERAIAEVRSCAAVSPVVVDLGTGSGVIGLSVALECLDRGVRVWLTDASADALAVARANLAGIGRAAAGVRVVCGDWWSALPADLRGGVHVAAANPPYVAIGDDEVEHTVLAHEPHSALFSGTDGLDDLRRIIDDATNWLAPGGVLVCEIGHRQGEAVLACAAHAGLVDARVDSDLAGRDRVFSARRA